MTSRKGGSSSGTSECSHASSTLLAPLTRVLPAAVARATGRSCRRWSTRAPRAALYRGCPRRAPTTSAARRRTGGGAAASPRIRISDQCVDNRIIFSHSESPQVASALSSPSSVEFFFCSVGTRSITKALLLHASHSPPTAPSPSLAPTAFWVCSTLPRVIIVTPFLSFDLGLSAALGPAIWRIGIAPSSAASTSSFARRSPTTFDTASMARMRRSVTLRVASWFISSELSFSSLVETGGTEL
eukprot:COSAG04_NODE_2307_length_4355_cov_1.791823_3_plen_243_part_00